MIDGQFMGKTSSRNQPLHVLVLGVEPQSLINFRKDLIDELNAGGYRITVAAHEPSAAQRAVLEALGTDVRTASFSRTGMNPFRDMVTLASLIGLFRKIRPDVVIAYTVKPVIYGALAARIAGVEHFCAMITGLGYSFVAGSGVKRRIARRSATLLYKIALKRCSTIIFQNPDDCTTFANLGLLKGAGTVGIVNGSGVDLQHFQQWPLPSKPLFLMVSRLLIDKGIREYAEAAGKLRKAMPDVRTILVGGLDPSANSVKQDELDGWVAGGLEYLGQLSDVRSAIAQASVVVLPSYREGTPRSVLEGMAMGRAIITTDVPGCRETVKAALNGILVPPRNADALFNAMMSLAGNDHVVESMGRASRKIAEEKYEGKSVARNIMRLAGLA
jgi:glycosyltransferase involved in cell wall biosynthesis